MSSGKWSIPPGPECTCSGLPDLCPLHGVFAERPGLRQIEPAQASIDEFERRERARRRRLKRTRSGF
jgi:hypothetical protein